MKELKSPSDHELVNRIRHDDQQALSLLFHRYYAFLCDFSFQFLRNVALTQEVVSDVFLKLWIGRQQLAVEQSVRAYLYRAVKNQSLNYLQRESSFRDESLSPTHHQRAVSSYTPEQELFYQESLKNVEAIIEQMPPQRQLIFRLNRFNGLKYQEIAEVLSISVHTVQNQMVKAVQFMAGYNSTSR